MKPAHLADASGELASAIDLYEKAINDQAAELIDYLNLICIYFQCMDFGYASGLELRPEIEANASTRALELVELAKTRFGGNDELEYWGKVIPYFGWGEPIVDWNLDGSSMMPYLFIAREHSTEDNLHRVKVLRDSMDGSGESERTRYIAGKIESIFEDGN